MTDARWREADEEAADAVKDVYDDGEPVLLRYEGSYVAEGDRTPTVVDPVDVPTHAVFARYSDQERSAGGIRDTDVKIKIAHGRRAAAAVKHAGLSLLGLGDLQDEILALPTGRTPKASGMTVYQHEQALARTGYPTAGGANVRTWDVVAKTREIRDAGVPVLHELQARA